MKLLNRRPNKAYLIVLLCTCKEALARVNASGETLISVTRQCSCGNVWSIDLELAGWSQGVPNYIVRRFDLTQP